MAARASGAADSEAAVESTHSAPPSAWKRLPKEEVRWVVAGNCCHHVVCDQHAACFLEYQWFHFIYDVFTHFLAVATCARLQDLAWDDERRTQSRRDDADPGVFPVRLVGSVQGGLKEHADCPQNFATDTLVGHCVTCM